MVTEHMDYDDSSLDAPRTNQRDNFIRLRAPRASRTRSQTRKTTAGTHGGVRQRRNKRWSW
jgi:hypothetical protein